VILGLHFGTSLKTPTRGRRPPVSGEILRAGVAVVKQQTWTVSLNTEHRTLNTFKGRRGRQATNVDSASGRHYTVSNWHNWHLKSILARSRTMRSCGKLRFGGGMLLLLASAGLANVAAQDKDMVPNPVFKHWSAFKVGTTVTLREKVKFPPDSEEGQRYHESTLIKDTTYKLLEASPQKVVVEVIEMEHGRGSLQESAPFKIIYFPEVKKNTGTPKESFASHKQSEDVKVTVHGKAYNATLVETVHKAGPITRTHQVWLSDEIPGGTLKDARSQKSGNQLISESTLEVLSFKVP
jgi:hypothetical protein